MLSIRHYEIHSFDNSVYREAFFLKVSEPKIALG